MEAQPQRIRVDRAHQVERLPTTNYPDADTVTVVINNLNTRHTASLCEASAGEGPGRTCLVLNVTAPSGPGGECFLVG